MANAYVAVVEAVGIELAGCAPYDVELADRAVRGVLGLPPPPASADPQTGRIPPSVTDTQDQP